MEKCKTLNTSVDKLRRELDASKERASKFSELVIKHEQSLSLNVQVKFGLFNHNVERLAEKS